MRGLFLFPPCFDPSMPYLAPYLLSTFVNSFFGQTISEVVDLNVLFYNEVCQNRYQNIDENMNVSSAIDYFFLIEHEMDLEMKAFGSKYNVNLTRQSLLFDYDRLKSENVFNYLNSESSFANLIIQMVKKEVDLSKYNFIGLNVSCQDQLVPALIIAKYVKDSSAAKVIIGGNIVSRCYSGLIESNLKRYFDFLVIKEGEYALCNIIHLLQGDALVESLSANAIYSCQSNSIIDNTDNINIIDINDIPAAEFDAEILDRYFAPELVLPVFFSRGCSWGKCSFCGIHSSWCAKYRSKKPEQFCDELEHYINVYGCTNFRFIDESPSIHDILAVANEIVRRNLQINIESYLNISKHLLDKNVVQVLSKAGVKQLFFGIESVTANVLSDMNKDINDPSFFSDILDNTAACGIHNYAFFLMGYPTDQASNEETLEKFMIQTDSLGTISVSSFIPVMGTTVVSNEVLSNSRGIEYALKGDLTNKCNYKIGGIDASYDVKLRTKRIVETIMAARSDLRVSSKMPYETRFYMCFHYGSDFGKKYNPSKNVSIDSSLSKEQEARAVRPE